MRKIERISISDADRRRLERLVRDGNTPQKLVWRARIVLLASDGLTAAAIAAAVSKSLLTVRRWRRRYMSRPREFLHFLRLIDQKTPQGLDLHLVVDNYATHKTPAIKRWLKAHPRFNLHFTPTSASWLNMVERFFAEITRNRIRRGAVATGWFCHVSSTARSESLHSGYADKERSVVVYLCVDLITGAEKRLVRQAPRPAQKTLVCQHDTESR